jgi:hypothetical protein
MKKIISLLLATFALTWIYTSEANKIQKVAKKTNISISGLHPSSFLQLLADHVLLSKSAQTDLFS